jgi:hypothetical protein
MSLKSLSKTRWKLEANRITVYPYGLYYILTIVLAVIFAAILFVFTKYENASIASSLPFALILLLAVVIFWGLAGTSVEFDNDQGVMRKKLMGFIPVTTLPFNKILGINVVSNIGQGYNYRLFKKDDRYGKGILVSSAYGKNDDPNAIAFVNEVIPLIHDYLNQHDTLSSTKADPVTDYRYFTQESGSFTIKKNKIAALILGLLMFAVGIHEFTPGAWMNDLNLLGKACVFIFFVMGGPLIIIGGFTTVTFDPAARTIQRKSPVGIGSKTWNFQDFVTVQTIRRSINFIYSGTDIQMHFQRPENNKPEAIVVKTFRRSRSIDRFVRELYQIMGIQ